MRHYDRRMPSPAPDQAAAAAPRNDPSPPSAPAAANLLGLDYRAEAGRLGAPVAPIVDVHTHVNGERAAAIWREVADLYGVERTYSQTVPQEAPAVRRVLGERVRFIAVADFSAEDKWRAFTEGFLADLDFWHGEMGARCVKIWNAPRFRELAREFLAKHPGAGRAEDLVEFDSPWRRRIAEKAAGMGMMFMVHCADPDTWFRTKYADAKTFRTKPEQYPPLERMLRDFAPTPWIAAHMGGWPENLDFLDALLDRHENLWLDTSATKWMVRELSRHPSERMIAFLERWKGRILFGSDVVTTDDHLRPDDTKRFAAAQAGTAEEAFELYASRYWALRTMWETGYDGPSPIADPDLMMVEPEAHDAFSSPRLVGHRVPADLLRTLYREAPLATIGRWYDGR